MILSGYSSLILEMRSVRPRPGATSQGVSQLEALETITGLSLFSDNIENRVNQLGSFCVVTLGPIVAGPRLSEHEVVGSEDLTEGPRPHAVHGAGLQVHEDSPGHVLAAAGLVVVDIDPLQLELGGAGVGASGVDTVLIGDDLPKLGSNLITALTSLKMDNFSHDECFSSKYNSGMS